MTIKAPISYYGGKQRLASFITTLIPPHNVYVEPFFGGGAVFWAKNPSISEVINDLNDSLINFYRVLKYRYDELAEMLDETFHSRSQHVEARKIYRDETVSDELLRAWALFVQTNGSFAHKICGGYRFDRAGSSSKSYNNKINAVKNQTFYRDRLQNVNIECQDAIKVIQSYDTPDTFFYCDPPYIDSDCGHYKGYTAEDYARLLKCLSEVKGKFILSSYPDPILDSFVRRFGWTQQEKKYKVSVNNRAGVEPKTKTEVITLNF